jgi:ADP-heptose:LPS heptosyltransferase
MMAGIMKKIELANKFLWKRFFRVVFVKKRRATSEDLEKVRKVIFVRYDRIGDMIVSTPLFRGIKAINKEIKVGVIAGEDNSRVIACDPNVDDVYVFSRLRPVQSVRGILKARKEGYEAIVNLILNDSLTGSLLANFIAPRGIKIARESREHSYFYDLLVPIRRDNDRSMVNLLFPFLEVFGPLPSDDVLKPYLEVGKDASLRVLQFLEQKGIARTEGCGLDPYIVINVSARKPIRRWCKSGYIGLVREILALDLHPRVIVLSDPGDMALRDDVVEPFDGKPVHPYHSTNDLMEIAALIGMAKAVVTPDTSIIHFASAMRTPVVGLYTRREPRPTEWQPYLIPHRSVFAEPGEPVTSIPAGEVFKEFVDLMKEVDEMKVESGYDPCGSSG